MYNPGDSNAANAGQVVIVPMVSQTKKGVHEFQKV